MTFVLADRVQETTTTTGTGTLTLAGAAMQYQSFNAGIGSGNVTYYGLLDANGTAWETGIGTMTSSTTLARTTILESSNSNAAISLSTGTHTVYCNQPAQAIQTPVAKSVPNASGWSFINQNSATLTSYPNGPLVWTCVGNIGSDQISAVSYPVPGGSWTWTVHSNYIISDANTFGCWGITDGTKIKFFLISTQSAANEVFIALEIQHWNSFTSPSGSGTDTTIHVTIPNNFWMQIIYDSTTPSLTYNYSIDGYGWIPLYSESGSLFLTPTAVWIGADINRGSTQTPSYINLDYMTLG